MTGVTDFFALDVETANADPGSICSIGLVHFKGREVFRSLSIAVDPQQDFHPANIRVHGIRPADVIGAPTMATVFPVINEFLNGTIITHHSAFDRRAFASAAARYNVANTDAFWLDTVVVARRTWREFAGAGGYGLANLSRAFGISFTHHQAVEDARASGLIMLRALEDSGYELEDWLDLIGSTPEPVLTQRPAPPSRKHEAFARHAMPGVASGKLAGEIIVFTGFLTIARAEAARRAAAAGCDVVDSVTKRITILVVGEQDLRLTRGQDKSTKHRKAEDLISKGGAIRIIGESEFLLMVG
jgi:DNA polymerase-3 subunit epsilon